ncbi:MAG: glycosyltransferase family 39 protein, partial [Oscillospiraceae bacterium]
MPAINIFTFALSALLCVVSVFARPLGLENKTSLRAGRDRVSAFVDKYFWLILIAITALGTLVRFYKLTEIPQGIHIDEASTAYDAYTMMTYGCERFLYPNPVYLINYGGGANSLYAYLSVASYRLFGGYSLFALRLPGALFGALAVPATCALANEISGRRAGLVGAFLCAIFPVCIMSSRFGLEVYIMHGIVTFALFCLCRAINRSSTPWYFAAGFMLGAALYCYSLAYIIVPCFVLLTLIWLIVNKRISFKQVVALGVPLFLLALPLMLFLAVNNGMIEEIVTPWISIPKLPQYRGSELSIQHALSNYAEFRCLFLNDPLPYNAVKPYYTMYLMSVPLVLYGLGLCTRDFVLSMRRRTIALSALFLFWTVGCFVCCTVIGGVNNNRMISIFVCFIYFAVRALREIWKLCAGALVSLLMCYCLCFVMFASYYFTRYTKELSPMPYFAPNALEAYSFARDKSPEDTVYYLVYRQGTTYQNSYIYPLLADLENPYDFND